MVIIWSQQLIILLHLYNTNIQGVKLLKNVCTVHSVTDIALSFSLSLSHLLLERI